MHIQKEFHHSLSLTVLMFVEYKLQKSRNSDEDLSSEIVVVHEKGVPKLHGILKQRSVSESSDDGVRSWWSGRDRQTGVTTGSEDDDNEDSPDRSAALWANSGSRQVVRKSVSFNDHIDRTLFQANQSVSSMHAALKNRRRRARKRDQKQEQREQRRRRRSSGSFSLEESGDEQAAGAQAACIHAKKAFHASIESSECVEDCSSSVDVTSDGVDGSLSSTILYDTETASDEVISSEDVLGSESASVNGNCHGNDKPVESTLLKSKLSLIETQNENVSCSDALRTTNYVEDSGSNVVDDGICDVSNVCDMSPVHVISNDENCECDVNSMDVMCDGLRASSSLSESVVSCSSDRSVELSVLSQTADCSMSGVGYEDTSFVFDLDVD